MNLDDPVCVSQCPRPVCVRVSVRAAVAPSKEEKGLFRDSSKSSKRGPQALVFRSGPAKLRSASYSEDGTSSSRTVFFGL